MMLDKDETDSTEIDKTTADSTQENDNQATADLTQENDNQATADSIQENDDKATADLAQGNDDQATADLTQENITKIDDSIKNQNSIFSFNNAQINQISSIYQTQKLNFHYDDNYLLPELAEFSLDYIRNSSEQFNSIKYFYKPKKNRKSLFSVRNKSKSFVSLMDIHDKNKVSITRPSVTVKMNEKKSRIEISPFSGIVNVEKERNEDTFFMKCQDNTIVLQKCLQMLGRVPSNINELDFDYHCLNDLHPEALCFFTAKIPVESTPFALHNKIKMDQNLKTSLIINNLHRENELLNLITLSIARLGLKKSFLADGNKLYAEFKVGNPEESNWQEASYYFRVDDDNSSLFFNYFHNTRCILQAGLEEIKKADGNDIPLKEIEEDFSNEVVNFKFNDDLFIAWLESELLYLFHNNYLQWSYYITTYLQLKFLEEADKNIYDTNTRNEIEKQFQVLKYLRLTQNLPPKVIIDILIKYTQKSRGFLQKLFNRFESLKEKDFEVFKL